MPPSRSKRRKCSSPRWRSRPRSSCGPSRSRQERDPRAGQPRAPVRSSAGTAREARPPGINEHEAAFLLGERVEGVDGALDAAPRLLSLGPASVVVTLGEDGAVFSGSEAAKHLRLREEVVDTTGAGDAFVGALSARLAEDAPLEDAVAYAVRAGAAAVTEAGAQGALPTPETVDAL